MGSACRSMPNGWSAADLFGRRPRTASFRFRRHSSLTCWKRQATQRVVSSEGPPPGTTQWTCGWCCRVWPQVWRTMVMPSWAPRCPKSAAMMASVSAAAPRSKKLCRACGGNPCAALTRHTGRGLSRCGWAKSTSSPIAGPGRVHVPVPPTIKGPNRPICSVRSAPERGGRRRFQRRRRTLDLG